MCKGPHSHIWKAQLALNKHADKLQLSIAGSLASFNVVLKLFLPSHNTIDEFSERFADAYSNGSVNSFCLAGPPCTLASVTLVLTTSKNELEILRRIEIEFNFQKKVLRCDKSVFISIG